MTNTEAITKLTNIMHDDHYSWHPSILTAFSMAVDALKGAETGRTKTRDVVDREDVIKAIIMCAEIDPFNRTVRRLPQSWRNSLIMCMGSIPSAQGKPDWIPCSERLPEMTFDYEDEGRKFYSSSTVLISTKNNEVALGQFRHIGGHESYYVMSYLEDEEEVLAWMPLPKVYKKEGETDD